MPTSDMYAPPPAQTNYAQEMEVESDHESEEDRRRQAEAARQKQAQEAAKPQPGAMKIRSDYVPRAAAAAASRRGQQLALCPNCGQQIPINELDEHVRIELLDPRWKEQRARAEARFATTNLNVMDAATNIKRLASAREDLFDDAGRPLGAEEQERRKRAATGWDGGAESRESRLMGGQGMNVQEQIKAIHEKQQALVNPGVGPKR